MPQFLSAMLVRVKHPILIGGQSCTLVSMCSKKLKSWKSYLFQPSSLDKSCEITTTSGEPDVRHCSATSSNLKFIYIMRSPQKLQEITHCGFDRLKFPFQFEIRVLWSP